MRGRPPVTIMPATVYTLQRCTSGSILDIIQLVYNYFAKTLANIAIFFTRSCRFLMF